MTETTTKRSSLTFARFHQLVGWLNSTDLSAAESLPVLAANAAAELGFTVTPTNMQTVLDVTKTVPNFITEREKAAAEAAAQEKLREHAPKMLEVLREIRRQSEPSGMVWSMADGAIFQATAKD